MLLVIGAGALAHEIVYSELAYMVKKLFALGKEHITIKGLAAPKMWRKILTLRMLIVLAPVIFPILVLLNFHRFLFKVLSCVYCTAFWLSLITCLLIGKTVLTSIMIASCAMFFAGLYNLIRKYAA